MFKWIGRKAGRDAVDGAITRVKELASGWEITIGKFKDFSPNEDIEPITTYGIKFKRKK